MKSSKAKPINIPLRMMLTLMVCLLLALGISPGSALAHEADPHPHAEDSEVGDTKYEHPQHGTLGQIGAKLANPLGDLWALSMSFNMPQFYDGDANTGDPELGATLLFEPIMPLPLHGTGDDELRLITRPVIPIIFSEPIPKGADDFDHTGGIGDIQLPLLLSVPKRIAGNFILGAGPVGLFPTATDDDLGQDQWALGPAVVLGYKNKFVTAGVSSRTTSGKSDPAARIRTRPT